MKIGIDAREFQAKSATGIARYLRGFLKYALEHEHEHEYILFCNHSTHIPFQGHHIKKVFIPEYLTFWWDQVQLPSRLKKEKIDLFLTPYFKAPPFVLCKLVVIINDLIPILAPEYQGLKRFLKRTYFRKMASTVAKRADKIITISNHSKKDIIETFQIPEEKVKVIYLGVDEDYKPFESNLEKITSKYGIVRRFILYLGNFNPHKNVKTLIEAYHRLPREIKDEYQLVLGGRRDRYCKGLEKMIKHLKLEEKIIFTGFIPEEDMPLIYSAAELFVFPSLYEGFGLPPLEAMACGTPVITSNLASLPEVVGDAGILVNSDKIDEIKEAIIKVLFDSALRNDLIKRGVKRAKQFTPKKTAKQILEVFTEVYPVRNEIEMK